MSCFGGHKTPFGFALIANKGHGNAKKRSAHTREGLTKFRKVMD